jgi:DNA-binding NarL/FixJ family response regulator
LNFSNGISLEKGRGMATRILVAEDHQLVADGYRALLATHEDLQVVGAVTDGNAVVAAAAELSPQVLLLDLSLPGRSGLDLLSSLRARGPRVVVVTGHSDESYVARALDQGALGYVLKRDPADDLIAAVRAAAAGAQFLSRSISRERLYARPAGGDPYDSLSEREREVLHYTARGKTLSEVASFLGLSIKGVETHRRRARQKLGVTNQAELVRLMVRREALDPDLV